MDGSVDGSGSGGSGVATPRLIAPLSMAAVTQQRPTLRWVLGEGAGAPVVDLCRDRACTQPIAASVQIAADHRSAVPMAALPAGWVYWRVRVVSGDQIMASRTWQFWVGRSSASSPVDTSAGIVLDINGDGYPDFVVGAADASSAHVYLGSASVSATDWNGASPPARIDLLTFDPGNSRFGVSVTSAGDVNGDGYGDFLVACPGGAKAYLYFGSAAPRDDNWNGLAPSQRINVTAQGGLGFGGKVAGVGDVNGDGFADFLVAGRSGESYENAGAAWLYLGSATPSTGDWNAMSSPRRVALEGPDVQFGFNQYAGTIASAGDVNGDGYADFIVGDWESNKAFVYLGSSMVGEPAWNGTSPAQRIDLTMPGGTYSSFGVAAAGAGDVNGDGYADFLVGDAGSGNGLGAVHLYLGSAAADPAAWNQAASSARVDLASPEGANFSFGSALASAGDVNGDGYSDFLIGADGAEVVHLYLGFAAANAASWNGASPSRRIDLASPGGSGSRFGISAASARDVDGDGYGDFVIGADTAIDRMAQGTAYLYLGSATLDGTGWSGMSPSMRRDLVGPDGAGGHFGNSVAMRRARVPVAVTFRRAITGATGG
jgi:hypothetical protein